MRFGPAWLLSITIALGGCQHARPPQFSPVAIPATQIRATDYGIVSTTQSESESFVKRGLTAARKASTSGPCGGPEFAGTQAVADGAIDYLVLSGGSLNGAFGAGFFLGLQEAGALPPEPRVVTGISTGSLQSTFLFLARQTVPKDRDYSWVGGLATEPGNGLPELKPGRSNIEDLTLAYSIRQEGDILKPTGGDFTGLVLKGAKGRLDPLRKRLLALISPDTIRQVAAQACRGRKLYVGVANVDDGYGYALDMTELALRAFDGDASPQLMTLVREAYVAGLIASSSVPIGAFPVTLRIRDFDLPLDQQHRTNLYIDGGARFGVFLREIARAEVESKQEGVASHVTMMVNTRLVVPPWQSGDLRKPDGKWSPISLAPRAVDLLENQVYQLSIRTVEDQADALRMAYISNYNIENGELPDDHQYRGKGCGKWHDDEKAALKPIQFYPGYMACLIDYGRTRGRAGQWNKK